MLSLSGAPARADAAKPIESRWPDTLQARAEAQVLLEGLNAGLLGAPTATSFLDDWCARHKFANGALVRARVVASGEKPVSEEQRLRLRIEPGEAVKYRRVELVCGDAVLSEADNWYVPGRLTPEMNRILTTTDAPFGRVVQDLKPRRQTFSAQVFWKPLANAADAGGPPPDRPGEALEIPWRLFEHSAVVVDASEVPFSEVREFYTRELLLGAR